MKNFIENHMIITVNLTCSAESIINVYIEFIKKLSSILILFKIVILLYKK